MASKFKEIKIKLADEPLPPSDSIGDALMLIYGERGIGKTTLFSEFPDPYFLYFEPGGKYLRTRHNLIPDWKTFLKWLEAMEQKPKGYCQNIIADTGYMMYERCHTFWQDQLKLSDPRDKAWGNGWKRIDREFRDVHDRLFALAGFGVTAHSETKTIKLRNVEIDKVVTQLGGQAHRWYAGLVDVIGYYHYSPTGERFLRIRGSSKLEAKCRMPNNFRYTDGTPVVKIPMGESSKEAYRNFMKAFNNQLQPKEGSKKK